MKVAITGANGKVGQALISELDLTQFKITELDLPDHDSGNLDDLIESTKGHDALIHFAWKDLDLDSVDPLNGVMYENAYKAAVANNIGLVIMGSSNHAHDHNERETDGKIRYTGQAETANNIYGVEKQKMEAMGRYFAKKNNLSVLCLRIGNVNPEDKPRPDVPTRWLSHNDLGRLVTLALQADFELGHFEVMYGVSRQPVFDWVNTFGYEPQDAAE
jgi:nucleoside-diphosphate-sugar epimerase